MGTIDYDLLETRFYFTREAKENAVFSIPAADLLHKDNMDRFLEAYMPLIRAHEADVAGTHFCSWFRAVCVVQQYAVSVCDSALDLSLSNLTVQLYPKENRYWFSFQCHDLRESRPPAGGREKWRKEVFTALYRDQVRPLFESVSRSAGVNTGQLWGQLPSGFQYYIDSFLEEASDESVRRRIAEDYRFLSEELDGDMFGRKKNPFAVKHRMIENPRDPGKPMRLKTSCCLYYRTEGGSYCYTCPRMTEAEREERSAKIAALRT